jgi:hypothetical protein
VRVVSVLLAVASLTTTPTVSHPTYPIDTKPNLGAITAGLERVSQWYHQAQLNEWYAAVQTVEHAKTAASMLRPEAASTRAQTGPVAFSGTVNGYPCGGNLPPCCVLRRESGGTPTAQNPSSSASGLWQFLDSTWDHYGGYARAKDAPASVQNARAAQVWKATGGSAWYPRCW